jgi:two-component system response regulator
MLGFEQHEVGRSITGSAPTGFSAVGRRAFRLLAAPAMNEGVILLVEDNPDDEALTLRALQHNNIRNPVVVVRDGAAALAYLLGTGATARQEPPVLPSLVLLDVKLPKVDGVEVLRRLRSDERTKALPVIVLTASQEEEDRIDRYDFPRKGCIRKPLNVADLVDATRRLGLQGPGGETPPPKDRGT